MFGPWFLRKSPWADDLVIRGPLLGAQGAEEYIHRRRAPGAETPPKPVLGYACKTGSLRLAMTGRAPTSRCEVAGAISAASSPKRATASGRSR